MLFTGLIGVVVDAATGSWNKLRPESATVSLTKVDASVEGPDTILVSVSRGKRGLVIDAPADLTVGVAREE